MITDMHNCSSSPSVVSLQDFRQICRKSATDAVSEQVSGRAHVHDSNPAHGRLFQFPKTAHVRHSKAQRIADSAAKAAHVQGSDWHLGEMRHDPIVRNERLRAARQQAWQGAKARLDYWRSWRETHRMIRMAKDFGILKTLDCPNNLV